jgi:hypothetical protein
MVCLGICKSDHPTPFSSRSISAASIASQAASCSKVTNSSAFCPCAIDISAITDVGSNGDVITDNFIFAGDDRLVREVWSAGRHVVTSGQHFAHEQITENYRSVLFAVKDWL